MFWLQHGVSLHVSTCCVAMLHTEFLGYTPSLLCSLQLLGIGKGRFNATTAKLNTVNPVYRDTATMPDNGWIAFRFLVCSVFRHELLIQHSITPDIELPAMRLQPVAKIRVRLEAIR
jgi:Multicopper oxidase